ncbi:MAG: hypothetical protein HKN25_10225 [Pyrinomonadaceae bacterium]|nr:hypothetical protein [Pyrinomonadaceae bacterium]
MKNKNSPLTFFITFRCYGTWLHGDQCGSTTRFQNKIGEPFVESNKGWLAFNKRRLKHAAFKLRKRQRPIVTSAIVETCEIREWLLHAVNVRTNHVHVVVGSGIDEGKKVLGALKANATRALREKGLCDEHRSPWSKGGSIRYVWDISALGDVVDYVLNGQGNEI